MRCLVCLNSIDPQVTWENFLQFHEKDKLCTDCSKHMERITRPGCPRCFRTDSKGVCYDCERWEESYDGVLEKNVSVFRYNDFSKEVVARWKYRGDYVLMKAYQMDILNSFNLHYPEVFPLVAIPLSKARLKERGFNQSEAIIRLLQGDPHHLLTRTGDEKQSKKQRSERIHSTNPFTLTKAIHDPIILIDDIYTTGSTLRHAASLLKKEGCPHVYAFTIFR
ncbi:ComF family protein [Halobacillus mangrovi]|uniref:Amidophosphoribosyltransferase n=1 Tax=Halobacillus mangrovi TaxID=402384 RepID=A0A1W5ZTA3_9BACI|nr:ComF family protein [Halobacillus mangrovi]ARI76518.1 amidophosphoribosyltransferase [Halobacillus mangrovi]